MSVIPPPRTSFDRVTRSAEPSAQLPSGRADVLPPIEPLHPTGRELTPRRRGRILAAIGLADILVVLGAVALAWPLRNVLSDYWAGSEVAGSAFTSHYGWAVLGVWLTLLAVSGVFRPRHLAPDIDEFRILTTTSLGALALTGFAAFVTDSDMPRAFLLIAFGIGLPLLLLVHFTARRLVHRARRNGHLRHRVLVVGAPEAIAELHGELLAKPYAGYEIVGACVPGELGARSRELDVPLLGSVEDVAAASARIGADTVMVVGGGLSAASDLKRIGWALEGTETRLIVSPSVVDVAGPRVTLRVTAGLPLVHVEAPTFGAASGLAKRGFDLVATLGILLFALPVIAVSALAVRLDDGGPVFFRQRRVGRNGEEFRIWKLRTMAVDAEQRLADLAHLNEVEGAVLFKVKHDPRITRVGAFLRRFSLDELPQLFNVLTGDMSLVGPRPPLPTEVAQYGAEHHRRLLVRPGMTGLWQVSGRSDLDWEESVKLDLSYVENWSMVGDFLILARTAKAVVARDGAY